MEWVLLWIVLSAGGERTVHAEAVYSSPKACMKDGFKNRRVKMDQAKPDFVSFVCKKQKRG